MTEDGDDGWRCRILPCHPALPEASTLPAALDRLFRQFAREGRLGAWSCRREHDGACLVLAWAPAAPLSGCSQDKIAGVLARHEGIDGVALLAPPPLVIQVDGTWRCVDRAMLRRIASAGTPLLDTRIERLGDWRGRGLTTIGASWAAALLPPARGGA